MSRPALLREKHASKNDAQRMMQDVARMCDTWFLLRSFVWLTALSTPGEYHKLKKRAKAILAEIDRDAF